MKNGKLSIPLTFTLGLSKVLFSSPQWSIKEVYSSSSGEHFGVHKILMHLQRYIF
jgi:hypothetical protein